MGKEVLRRYRWGETSRTGGTRAARKSEMEKERLVLRGCQGPEDTGSFLPGKWRSQRIWKRQGTRPPSGPTATVFEWTSGRQETTRRGEELPVGVTQRIPSLCP